MGRDEQNVPSMVNVRVSNMNLKYTAPVLSSVLFLVKRHSGELLAGGVFLFLKCEDFLNFSFGRFLRNKTFLFVFIFTTYFLNWLI